MNIYTNLPSDCQKLIAHYLLEQISKPHLVWIMASDLYSSTKWGPFNSVLQNVYVMHEGISLVAFGDSYMKELHDQRQSPVPLIEFSSVQFSNILSIIGNNVFTFKTMEIRVTPSSVNWRLIQMLATGCESIKMKCDYPFKALLAFDDSMLKKLDSMAIESASTSDSIRIHSKSLFKFSYGPKDLSSIRSTLLTPQTGLIEINCHNIGISEFQSLFEKVKLLKAQLTKFKFRFVITSALLEDPNSKSLLMSLNLFEISSLKIETPNFDWFRQSIFFGKFKYGIRELVLKHEPPDLHSFPNLKSFTIIPSVFSTLDALMAKIPKTVQNLHLDLSNFITGFSFKIPPSIEFLEIMCHYLPINHVIDTDGSNVEILALTIYSESKHDQLRLTKMPPNLHFMEIRRCFRSEAVQINPNCLQLEDHIKFDKR